MSDRIERVSAREVLDAIKAQLAATTPGPWVHGGNGYVEDVPEFDLHRFDIMSQTIAVTELRLEDAEFIAHAPVNVARLTAAVEVALALHQREVLAVHEGYGEEAWCANCREHWPCEEYAAIENALEGS